jgi:hypothetical protein
VVVLGQVAVEMVWRNSLGRPTRMVLIAVGAAAGSGGWRWGTLPQCYLGRAFSAPTTSRLLRVRRTGMLMSRWGPLLRPRCLVRPPLRVIAVGSMLMFQVWRCGRICWWGDRLELVGFCSCAREVFLQSKGWSWWAVMLGWALGQSPSLSPLRRQPPPPLRLIPGLLLVGSLVDLKGIYRWASSPCSLWCFPARASRRVGQLRVRWWRGNVRLRRLSLLLPSLEPMGIRPPWTLPCRWPLSESAAVSVRRLSCLARYPSAHGRSELLHQWCTVVDAWLGGLLQGPR